MCKLFVLSCITITSALDLVGWWVPGVEPAMKPEELPWHLYTHVVLGAPVVSPTGIAKCNTSDDAFAKFIALGKLSNTKIVWRSGVSAQAVWEISFNSSWAKYRANYVGSIAQAVKECQVAGIEFDYECPPTTLGQLGIVSDAEATAFTQFLADIKTAMGPPHEISMDMGVWGVTRGSYPLMFRPWVNVSMVAAGAIDYINTMSYHYPFLKDEVFPWEKDAFILHNMWGIPKDKINLGLPYFFHNGTEKEPLWRHLSPLCPNLDIHGNQCAGVQIISKMDNFLVGQYIKKNGFRGAFPWAANFDSLENNNTMVEWLYRGLLEA
jgi:hypothetical protein